MVGSFDFFLDLQPLVCNLGGTSKNGADLFGVVEIDGLDVLVEKERAIELGNHVVRGFSSIVANLTNEGVFALRNIAFREEIRGGTHLGSDIELAGCISCSQKLENLGDAECLESSL